MVNTIKILIGINLSRQTNTNTPQQINFVRKLEEDAGATMFFIAENQQKKKDTIMSVLIFGAKSLLTCLQSVLMAT